MYKAFNLQLKQVPLILSTEKTREGAREFYVDSKQKCKQSLTRFIREGEINGTQLAEDWFPIVNADIFLSHSHADEDMAVLLAYMLHKNFGLKVFIDSMIWGNSNDLLQKIDKCAWIPEKDLYSYSIRNQTTSHIHMMLATSLQKMMDGTECTFFLNTPSSLTTDSVVDRTYSPWIYFEILQTQLLRRNIPERFKQKQRSFSSGGIITESLKISYDVNLSHMKLLTEYDIRNWAHQYQKGRDYSANTLDILYNL